MCRRLVVIGAAVVGASWIAGCDSLTGGPMISVLPPANAEPGRWFYLEGANNTRDIGGYSTPDGQIVRRQTVYRSGTLSKLTPAGCDAFGELGVKMVIDFRDRLTPWPPFDGDPWCVFLSTAVISLPVGAGGDDGTGRPAYVQAFFNHADSYRQAFERIADLANLPLLYHCGAGKDRTGIMTALLLTLLGVDRQTVTADYLLSNQVDAAVPEQAIADLLDDMEAKGGVEAYLSLIGVSQETQQAVRRHLLE